MFRRREQGDRGLKDLEGQVAIVTGASGGIGRSIAVELARRGAFVVAHFSTRADAAQETVEAVREAGSDGITIAADLAEPAEVSSMFAGIEAALKERGRLRIDILVNNAGKGGGGAIGDVTSSSFDEMIAVNAKGPLFTTQAALRYMDRGGRIINVSSMVGLVAYPSGIVYAMAKAALNNFTKALAVELGPQGITVNAVAPGLIETDLSKGITSNPELLSHYVSLAALNRLGQPIDIAGVVAFLASPSGGWITGQIIETSGGMHL